MGDSQALDVLSRIKLFCGLDKGTLAALQGQLERSTFAPGQDLCVEGEPGDKMFIIESGEVSVLKEGDNNELVEITVLKPGEIAGEMSLTGETVRSATLRARTQTETLTLSHYAVDQLIDKHPPLARSLLGCLASHLHRETSVVAKLLSQDIDRRFRVAFFNTKPYMKKAFSERNKDHFAPQFLEPKLTPDTVPLAAGARAVCVFVNDNVDDQVVRELKALGVGHIALRCAGYNNVDLGTLCAESDIITLRSCPRHDIW